MRTTDEERQEAGQPARPVPEKATEEERQDMERMAIFLRNRQAYPPEKLLEKYGGQWVAWSPDGTHIVAASSESEKAVYDQVDAAGLNLSECIISYIPAD